MNEQFTTLLSILLNSSTQAQVFHRQVTGPGSYSAHKALGTYYDEIIDLFDGLVESYQGKNGLITNYTCGGVQQYKSNSDTIKYFENLVESVGKLRESVKESYLQNQIDSVEELIYGTIYKLRFLS